jgi:hypothetical protein
MAGKVSVRVGAMLSTGLTGREPCQKIIWQGAYPVVGSPQPPWLLPTLACCAPPSQHSHLFSLLCRSMGECIMRGDGRKLIDPVERFFVCQCPGSGLVAILGSKVIDV